MYKKLKIIIILTLLLFFLIKKYYGSTSNLTAADIGALNSIMQGFSATALKSLKFKSTTSINVLGSLNLWTSAQVFFINKQ